jgi:hypothetical protein
MPVSTTVLSVRPGPILPAESPDTIIRPAYSRSVPPWREATGRRALHSHAADAADAAASAAAAPRVATAAAMSESTALAGEDEAPAPAPAPAPEPAPEPAPPAEPWHAAVTVADGMLPDPRRFHKPNLYALGVLCNIVYEDMDEGAFLALARKVNPGFTDVTCFDEGNAQAALFHHPEFLCLVFRGTSSDDPSDGSDWSSNLEALMELVEIMHLRGRVHTGFWRYADMLWEDGDGEPGIRSTLKAATDEKRRPIMVAGHRCGPRAAAHAPPPTRRRPRAAAGSLRRRCRC